MRLREPPPEHRSHSDLCAPKLGTGIGAMQPEACIKQIILKRSGARKSQQRQRAVTLKEWRSSTVNVKGVAYAPTTAGNAVAWTSVPTGLLPPGHTLRLGAVYGARGLCHATRASPRRRHKWYWRRSRVLVFHSSARVRAAACPRVRSAGSHAVCKIDANA